MAVPCAIAEVAAEPQRAVKARTGSIDGGHVRVGFEDNVYLPKGVLAKSNGELVGKVVAIAKLFGCKVATRGGVRSILNLPA